MTTAVLVASPMAPSAEANATPTLPTGLIAVDGISAFVPGEPLTTGGRVPVTGIDVSDITGSQFSPDGRSVLLTASSGSHYVTDWSGSAATLVAEDADVSGSETVWWAGDDQHLFVSRSTSSGNELWRESLDGSEREMVLGAEDWTGGLLTSTDGASTLEYVRHGAGGDDIARYDIGAGTTETLVPAGGNVDDIAAAPDGHELAFIRGGGLWLVTLDGTGLHQIVPSTDQVVGLAWGQDSAHLAFTKRMGGVVMVYDDAAGTAKSLGVGGVGSLSWQPLPVCTVVGTDGPDLLSGTPGDDVICGEGGDDTITTSAGHDIVVGGPGADTFDASGSTDPADIDLSSYSGTVQGTAEMLSIENVTGTDGNDVLRANGVHNTISGGDGDDRIVANNAWTEDALAGGRGTDLLDLSGASGAKVDLEAGTFNTTGSVSGFENVGGGDDNEIYGDDGPNVLQSGGSESILMGRGGDDTLRDAKFVSYAEADGPVHVDLGAGEADGADGDDTLVGVRGALGSAYADTFVGPTDAWFSGDAGDDTLELVPGSLPHSDDPPERANGVLDGGPGSDTLDANALTTWYRVGLSYDDSHDGSLLLAAGDWNAPTWFGNFENYQLTPYDDRFDTASYTGAVSVAAGAGDDQLTGGNGDDVLNGGPGDDTVEGGNGDDTIAPDLGSTDKLSGGFGTDLLDLSDSQGAGKGFSVDLKAGTLGGGTVSGFENVGGGDNDEIFGDDGPNVLQSGGRHSFLMGRGGDDTLRDAGQVSYAEADGPVQVDIEAGVADGPEGHDTLVDVRGAVGSSFADTLAGPVASWLVGGDGDDHLKLTPGTLPPLNDGATMINGAIDGGSGVDTLDASDLTAVDVLLWAPTDGGVSDGRGDGIGLASLSDVEGYQLTPYDDQFDNFGSFAVSVSAGAGNDVLDGGTGADDLSGGSGEDRVAGGDGADTLSGGQGADTSYGGLGADNVDAGSGNDSVSGGPGADVLVGGLGRDDLVGDGGADVIQAKDGLRDSVDGGAGRDVCHADRVDVVRSCP